MADNKKGVILYADLIHTFDELSDSEAGRLIKHVFRYVNDKNPEAPDKLTKLLFQPIKLQLKRDLEKWEATKIKRSDAGKASAEAKKAAKEAEQELTKSTSVESVEQDETNSTVNDTVTVNVNDTVINKQLEEVEEAESDFEITVELKKIKNLRAYVHQTFPKTEESLKMKIGADNFREREEAFILRNNEGSYTTTKDFRQHYTNFILSKPPPEKEKSFAKKEKPNRVEQLKNTYDAVLNNINALANEHTSS